VPPEGDDLSKKSPAIADRLEREAELQVSIYRDVGRLNAGPVWNGRDRVVYERRAGLLTAKPPV
jgi:hypothetical protein